MKKILDDDRTKEIGRMAHENGAQVR